MGWADDERLKHLKRGWVSELLLYHKIKSIIFINLH